jgi:hypothetical protein
MRHAKTVSSACLALLIALYVVGAVSVPPGSLRHEVQTLPIWFPIVLGFQGRPVAKWAALPCLVFWLGIMILIWLYLLGIARIVSGYFSPPEIAMTIIVGIACLVGLWTIARWKTITPPTVAGSFVVLFAILQVLAFRISLLPYIAHR